MLLAKMLGKVKRLFAERPATEIDCPGCGYYCLGRGGIGCIDKPTLVELESWVRPETGGVE